jgi:hypothetical protein
MPIIMLILAGFSYVILLLYKKNRIKFSKKQVKDDNLITVQKFINVKDIRKNFLYTRDNKIFTYIRIYPIDVHLLSKREQESKTNILTKEISVIQKPFKFLAVSKPTDISSLIGEYQEILITSIDQKQKEILRKEMLAVSDFATTGEAMERLFYVVLWDEYEEEIESEIIKVANDFISAYNTIGVKSEILKEREIYGLCNLVNNPGYSNEDIEEIFTPSIPILKEVI